MKDDRRPKYVDCLYVVLIGAMTLAILAFVIPAAVLTVADLGRRMSAAPRPSPVVASVPTPIARGDACPEPLCHSGPFDPMTGHPRAGGYKTVQQIDAEAR
jgi:hypothetical protein